MGFRILSGAIVLFWLVMTGLLVQLVYFPDESRMSQVDPDYVVGLFLRNKEISELSVFKGAEKVGEISLLPQHVPKDETGGVQTLKRDLIFDASGDVALPNLDEQMLRWNGRIRIAEDRSIEFVDISVRFEKPKVRVSLEMDPKKLEFNYVVSRDDVVVTDSKTDPNAPGLAELRLLMLAWGVNPAQIESAAAEQQKKSKISARHGNIKLGGKRFHAYVLSLDVMESGSVKLYFTDAGELVKVDTFLGYELLSEVLIPLELRARMNQP